MNKYFNPTNILLEEVKHISLKAHINIRYILSNENTSIIENVILYDLHLEHYLEDVKNSLMDNTAIVTFSKKNSFEEIKKSLRILKDNQNMKISNVALFQNNTNLPTYNIVSEETSTIENVITEDQA